MTMKPTRPFMPTVWTLTLLASIVLMAPAVSLAAETAPPAGFATRTAVLEAIRSGKLKLINRLIPVPDTIEVKKGVQYGTGGDTALRLDLYRPKSLDKPVPGLVFIHGGAWSGGKRSDYRYYGIKFAERGYVVATITYRLAHEAPFPAAVQDAKCAVRWMRANARELGVDPRKIAVVGGSAGGHLALMVGYSADVAPLEGKGGHEGVSSRVQAVVDLYGPADLTKPSTKTSQIVKRFLGGKDFDEAPEVYRLASPIHHVTDDDPPTLILHGTIDQVVSIAQSDALAEKLKETGLSYRYDRLEGWPHAMDMAETVNRRCQSLMVEFFDKYLPFSK